MLAVAETAAAMGVAHHHLGHLSEAIGFYKLAQDRFHKLKIPEMVSWAQQNIQRAEAEM